MPGMFIFPQANALGVGMLGAGTRDPLTLQAYQEAYNARERAEAEQQNAQAQLEHGLYAESRVRENPLWGPVEQLVSIPGYGIAKATGLMSGRSDPSLEQMAAGYRGLGRGMLANAGDWLNVFTGSPEPIARPPVIAPMTQRLSEAQLADFLLRNR